MNIFPEDYTGTCNVIFFIKYNFVKILYSDFVYNKKVIINFAVFICNIELKNTAFSCT